VTAEEESMSYQPNQGTSFAGEQVITRGPRKQSGLPRRGAQPNQAFELTHHPNRWGYTEELGFHPLLGRFHHEPGLGGVNGEGDLSAAEAKLLRGGWTIIQQQDAKLAKLELEVHGERWSGRTGYLRRFPVQGGGVHHVLVFQRPHVVVDRVQWIMDHDAHRAFVDHLVQVGLVYPLDPLVRETLVNKRQHAVSRLEHDVVRNPGNDLLRSRLLTETRVLARMRGEDADEAEHAARALLAQATAPLREAQRALEEQESSPRAAKVPARPKVKAKRGGKRA